MDAEHFVVHIWCRKCAARLTIHDPHDVCTKCAELKGVLTEAEKHAREGTRGTKVKS